MDLEIRLLGKLKPSVGRHLLAFYEDWTFVSHLSGPPTDPFLNEAYTRLEPLFMSHESMPNDVIQLTADKIDLHVEVDPDDYLDFLLDEFLPRALVSLEEGWFIFNGDEQRTMLTFDPKSKQITRTVSARDSWPRQQKRTALLQQQDRWEAEHGSMTVRQWRGAFNRF